MGAAEITQFLSSLAVRGNVAASTQNQALSALLFLYRQVLEHELPWLDRVVRAKRAERLPVVLTREEVRAVIGQLHGPPRLMAILMYGAGLRLLECARLRVKDVDFATSQIVVRAGKGDKDRVTILPAAVKADLTRSLTLVKEQDEGDLRRGAGWVELPWALGRKYPNAGREWGWQWVFPATRIYVDRLTGQRRRHHLRVRAATRCQGSRPASRDCQARELPHVSPFVRHAPAGGRPRHPHRAGALGPPGCHDHDDLHSRPQPRPIGRAESRRSGAGPMIVEGGDCRIAETVWMDILGLRSTVLPAPQLPPRCASLKRLAASHLGTATALPCPGVQRTPHYAVPYT